MQVVDAFFSHIEKYTAQCSIVHTEREEDDYKLFQIYRRREKEAYHQHTGSVRGTSLRTIWRSVPQRKLVVLGAVWYWVQSMIYMIEANALLYITMRKIPPTSPSFPGNASTAGSNSFGHTEELYDLGFQVAPDLPPTSPSYPGDASTAGSSSFGHNEELYDLGFQVTPDLSHRPWALKVGFVDMNVFVAQLLPPPLLLLQGRTERFTAYTGIIGLINILKGMIQMSTILPPARQGDACWSMNFDQQQLQTIRDESFWKWMLQPWGAAHGCNDMLWSGHTAQTTVGFLFIDRSLYEMRVPKMFRMLLVVYLAGYIWTVLACRMHYTIDVFVAVLLGVCMFTHSRLRMALWTIANIMVCNDPKPCDDASYGDNSPSSSCNGDTRSCMNHHGP